MRNAHRDSRYQHPKTTQPDAKAALTEIWNAEDEEHAQQAAKALEDAYGAKWPNASVIQHVLCWFRRSLLGRTEAPWPPSDPSPT